MTDADDIRVCDMAAALYDGGWRSTDRDEIIEEYELSEEDADRIVHHLITFENRDQKRLYEAVTIDYKKSLVRVVLRDADGEILRNDVREFEQDPDVVGNDEDSAISAITACVEEYASERDDDIEIVDIVVKIDDVERSVD